MKRINSKNINTKKYWNEHIAEPKFGLRQKKYLELAGKGESILELGCGLSPFLDRARDNFKHCVGIDFSEETLKKARKEFPNVSYYHSSAISTPFPENYFDVCVAGELIEHLEEPNKLLTEMIRIAKRKVIISTAKMEYNDPEHLWEFFKKDLEKYGKVAEVKSEWFLGRSYLFLTINL